MKLLKNILVRNWMIIILLVINVSALSSFFIVKISGNRAAPLEVQPCEAACILVDRIGFDQNQMKQYERIKESYDKDVFGIHVQLNESMSEMLAEVGKKNPDTAMINARARQFGGHQAQLKIKTMHHFMQIRKLTTPEQEERFEDLFYQLQHRRRDGMGRGRGRGDGYGRGRRMGSDRNRSYYNQEQIRKDTANTGWETY